VSRFVVTGAAGFIGMRLCAALRARGSVLAVVHSAQRDGPWDDAVVVDLSGEDVPAGAFDGAGVVFHFAGRAHAVSERHADAAAYRRVNVDGTRRVLEAAARARARRFVFASSVKAMGEGDGGTEPETPYGCTKREAEDLVLHAGHVPEPVVLRIALVYGPGVKGNLAAMLDAVRARRFPPPPPVANRRSLVHVDDVVRVALAAAERPAAVGRVLVVSDGVPYSTHAIYGAMRRALGQGEPTRALPAGAWRVLARLGDAGETLLGVKLPFDSDAHRKLFASAWYPPDDLGAILGITGFRNLDDALREMLDGR